MTILGYEIWKRDFSGDTKIVGQAVRINGKTATVIGIMRIGSEAGGTLGTA